MTVVEYPKLVFLDLSSACNATCSMCPTQLNPLRKKQISPILFEKIASQVAELPGLDWFFIGVHGEPTLDKRLSDKVKYCRDKGLASKVYITTNGSLLDQRRSLDLLTAEPGVVIFSIESMHPEVFEKIRRGLSYPAVMNNLRTFLETRDRLAAKTRVGIRFIESAGNSTVKEDYMTYWRPYIDIERKGDFFQFDRIHNWGYGDPNVFHGSSACAHIDALTVMSDGVAVFCCIDHEGVHVIGDANKESVLDIYNGKKARQMRELQISGQRHKLKMCSTCDLPETWAGQPMERYDDFVASDWIVPHPV
jgi:hypothetical protein